MFFAKLLVEFGLQVVAKVSDGMSPGLRKFEGSPVTDLYTFWVSFSRFMSTGFLNLSWVASRCV